MGTIDLLVYTRDPPSLVPLSATPLPKLAAGLSARPLFSYRFTSSAGPGIGTDPAAA
jgi:hypothetical protein